MSDLFNQTSARLISDLGRDFGLEPHQAAGIAGNFGGETGGFKFMQEIKPVVPGSRGGYGFAQWTGPRRREFERWTSERGLEPSSYKANYGFLRHELTNTPEKAVLTNLRTASSATEASDIFMREFERPGILNRGHRVDYANRALANYEKNGYASSGPLEAGVDADTGILTVDVPTAGASTPQAGSGGASEFARGSQARATGDYLAPAVTGAAALASSTALSIADADRSTLFDSFKDYFGRFVIILLGLVFVGGGVAMFVFNKTPAEVVGVARKAATKGIA